KTGNGGRSMIRSWLSSPSSITLRSGWRYRLSLAPNLIRKQAPSDRPRYGSVLLDTRVAGPHPYCGGDVDISVSFYQVQRANHAHALLKVVDSLSAAFGGAGDFPFIAKTGGALLEGVEGLLRLKETAYLAGHRISLAISPLDPFTAGFPL